MINLALYRLLSDDQGTLGVLYFGARFICYVSELPWRNNQKNYSSIPPGTYHADYLSRSASGKYKQTYHLRNVAGRSGVLIHSGNRSGDIKKQYHTDSRGCLLPGLRVGVLQGQRAVLASRAALQQIHAITQRQPFSLEII